MEWSELHFLLCVLFFFFKQKTAYEMCGRDWSSDVCSSDLANLLRSCLHLSLSLFLSPYLFPSHSSISLPSYFPVPISFPPLLSSSFHHSLSSFSPLTLSLSSMWVVMTSFFNF